MKDILINLDTIDMRTLYANTILGILVFAGLWNYAISLRIKHTQLLREKILLMCKDWDAKNFGSICMELEQSSFDWAWTQLPSFNGMVYSPKPLKLSYWLTKSAVQKLTAVSA
jgi:hypothetical protein